MKITIKEKRKIALLDFKKKLLVALGDDVLELKVFGSQARGDFKRSSDVDILLLVKKRNFKIIDLVYHLAIEILLKYGVDLSVKILTKKEFEKGLNLQVPFYLSVQKEGINL